MSMNQAVRQVQGIQQAGQRASTLVSSLSSSTGISEVDVAKVLEELGLSRVLADAVRLNNGQEPLKSDTRIAFKIGRTTIVC